MTLVWPINQALVKYCQSRVLHNDSNLATILCSCNSNKKLNQMPKQFLDWQIVWIWHDNNAKNVFSDWRRNKLVSFSPAWHNKVEKHISLYVCIIIMYCGKWPIHWHLLDIYLYILGHCRLGYPGQQDKRDDRVSIQELAKNSSIRNPEQSHF